MTNLNVVSGMATVAGVTAATCAAMYLAGPAVSALLKGRRPETVKRMGHPVYRWTAAVIILAFCVLGSYVLAGAIAALTGLPAPWALSSAVVAATFRRTTAMTDEEFPELEMLIFSAALLCVPLVMGVIG